MNSTSKSVECPFAWQLDESLVRHFDETEEVAVDVDEEPVLAFMKSIILTFFRAKNGDYSAASVKNDETNEIWNKMDLEQIKKEGISTRVLQHVKQATEYHLHRLAGDESAAALIMDALVDSRTLNSPEDRSTMEGCKSIAWLSFYEARHETGLKHAELAASGSPECPLWHFLLAKGYRYARKCSNLSRKPSEKERQAFLRCRELSSRPYYALHVAMMYGENGDYKMSHQIYVDIYEEYMNTPDVNWLSTLLRLAFAFMRSSNRDNSLAMDMRRAKNCLYSAKKIDPKNSMLLQYTGKFLMKIQYFMQALPYLEKAAKNSNYAAVFDLAECKKKLDRNFDYIQHFKMILTENKLKAHCKQGILLHIGMQYYNKNDYINAAKYLLESIEFNVDNHELKEFANVTVDGEKVNIFNLVCEKLLPKLTSTSSTTSADVLKLEDNLRSYCEPRKVAGQECLVKSYKKLNLKPRASNNK